MARNTFPANHFAPSAHFEEWLRVGQTRRPVLNCFLIHYLILLSHCVRVRSRVIVRLFK